MTNAILLPPSPAVRLAPTPAESGDLLDDDQLGHLRHFGNISRLPDNDWSGMLQRAPFQDDGATVRYQLAYSAFALALTHLHRLPAAPGLFKPVLERLIDKMLLPTVWTYWRDVSRGGGALNPYIDREAEWDPVGRENIMYSGYVQSMVALYTYLFDDRLALLGRLRAPLRLRPFVAQREPVLAARRERLSRNRLPAELRVPDLHPARDPGVPAARPHCRRRSGR
jgi:hypothetical protein